jgi:hypothetical protein
MRVAFDAAINHVGGLQWRVHLPPLPLRAAVIGAGYWGPNLARNFKASPDWELAGIVDMDRAQAVRVSAAHGDVAVFESIEELLDGADVDAVAIATPAHTHHGIGLTALRAGKHVLVEKPLADSRPRDSRWLKSPRSGVSLPSGRPEDPGTNRRRFFGRDSVHRLGADQPRPGPAGRWTSRRVR